MAGTKKTNKANEDIRAQLQALIAKGRKEGTLALSDLNAELEKLDLSVEKIEQIYEMFESMGIQLVGAETELDMDVTMLDLDLDGAGDAVPVAEALLGLERVTCLGDAEAYLVSHFRPHFL